MRWSAWWCLTACWALARGQPDPTLCDEDNCRCDAFTRVLCDCTTNYDEVTIRPDGAYRVPASATAIILNGCARAFFLQDAVKGLQRLREVQVNHVAHLHVVERALEWAPYAREHQLANPGLRIAIRNTTINELASHSVKGRVDEIEISDCRIHVVKPFTFSSLVGVKSVRLENNIYGNVENQAFKQFTTVNFIMRGGQINTIPSRFLSDVEVSELFKIDGVHVGTLSSSAFLVSAPKRVLFERNIIEEMQGDSLRIMSRGPITFRNNAVTTLRKGAFMGLKADAEVTSTLGRQELLIDNNTMTNVAPSSLAHDRSLSLRLEGLNLNASCSCELAAQWRELLAEQGGSVQCWYYLDGQYASIPTYVESRCGAFKQNFWIFIVVGVLVALLICVVVAYCVVKRESDKKKKVQIVMPDGKTYRETEFHIVVERAELLTTDL